MKHFDLMALYYPEACIKSEEGRYIEIRSVKNYKEYRLCRTKGNVNYYFEFADFVCFLVLPVEEGIIISMIFIRNDESGKAASITTTITSAFA